MTRTNLLHEYPPVGIGEAAAALGVTRLLVALAMLRGELTFSDIDGRRLTTPAWLKEWRHAG